MTALDLPQTSTRRRKGEANAATTPSLPLEKLEQECVASVQKARKDRDTYASLAALTWRIATDYKDRAVSELIQS